jgi:F-type H+-transporting ATPase subunit delta
MPAGAAHSTVLDPTAMTLAGVYAEALLGLAPSDDEAEEIAAELRGIAALLDEVEGFHDLLTTSMLSKDERQRLVGRLFTGRCDERIEWLLGVMARNDRLALVRAAARSLREHLDAREGKVEVAVATATELDESVRSALATALGEVLGAKALLTTRVKADLLGGAVVRIGDRVFDASIAAELKRLRAALLEKRTAAR